MITNNINWMPETFHRLLFNPAKDLALLEIDYLQSGVKYANNI